MKRKAIIWAIILSSILVLLEAYRWYGWEVDWTKQTVWEFLLNKQNTGLIWNLILAWMPVLFAMLIPVGKSFIRIKILTALWMLWLPNTLYLITDLKYFKGDKTTHILHELTFFGIYTLMGFLLYGLAIYIVWEKIRFRKIWLIIITVLSIIGVLIGRVLRWNSWDVFTDPGKIISFITNLF